MAIGPQDGAFIGYIHSTRKVQLLTQTITAASISRVCCLRWLSGFCTATRTPTSKFSASWKDQLVQITSHRQHTCSSLTRYRRKSWMELDLPQQLLSSSITLRPSSFEKTLQCVGSSTKSYSEMLTRMSWHCFRWRLPMRQGTTFAAATRTPSSFATRSMLLI